MSPGLWDRTRGIVANLAADHVRHRLKLSWSYPPLRFVLGKPRLDDPLDERNGQRLVERELHRAFGCSEAGQFVLELHDNGPTWKQADVIGEGGIPDDHAIAGECRNLVADDFCRIA